MDGGTLSCSGDLVQALSRNAPAASSCRTSVQAPRSHRHLRWWPYRNQRGASRCRRPPQPGRCVADEHQWEGVFPADDDHRRLRCGTQPLALGLGGSLGDASPGGGRRLADHAVCGRSRRDLSRSRGPCGVPGDGALETRASGYCARVPPAICLERLHTHRALLPACLLSQRPSRFTL